MHISTNITKNAHKNSIRYHSIQHHNRLTGFTIIELVLAIAILSVMLTLSYGSINSILRTKQILDDEQEVERAEQVLVRRLVQEFQLSFGRALLPPQNSLSTRYASNQNFIGVTDTIGDGQPADSVTFVARGAGQYFLEGRSSNSKTIQISYKIIRDPKNRGPDGEDLYALIREEVPYKRPYEQAYEEAIRFPLLESVDGLRLQYYDVENTEWVDTWGEDPSRRDTPKMISFTIFLKTPNGKERSISGTTAPR